MKSDPKIIENLSCDYLFYQCSLNDKNLIKKARIHKIKDILYNVKT
jgi:hypothetical protein